VAGHRLRKLIELQRDDKQPTQRQQPQRLCDQGREIVAAPDGRAIAVARRVKPRQ